MPATLETELEVAPKRPVGRPPLYSPERAQLVIIAVRDHGMSIARAAAKANVSGQTVREWTDTYPEFASQLAGAEADFIADRVNDLKACRNNNGTVDVKAQELLLRRFPEFQLTQRTEIDQRSLNISVTLTGDQLAKLQSQWQQALEDGK